MWVQSNLSSACKNQPDTFHVFNKPNHDVAHMLQILILKHLIGLYMREIQYLNTNIQDNIRTN